MQKRRCPSGLHKDSTPSLSYWPEKGIWRCFGCDYYENDGERPPAEEKYVEDIEASLSRIKALPVKPYRSLSLPCDDISAFIVWPGNDYYKRRFNAPMPGQPKYIGAAGHTKPLFVCPSAVAYNTLILVEGELNALSIAKVGVPAIVVSPGGVNDFYNSKSDNYLAVYLGFERLILLVDDDGPGVNAAISLKAKLLVRAPRRSRDIIIGLMSKDANQSLTEDGEDGLREEIKSYMDLSTGMCKR